jgi:enoyl-CoA hydratase/carnithine racemase
VFASLAEHAAALAADPPRGLLIDARGRVVSAGVDVFAAHGLCLTAAFELALACDLIVAAEGARCPAATLESWGVVDRVWPDAEFGAAARELAARLASGPTLAHAATKRLVGEAVERGVRAADDLVPEASGPLFATEDLRGAVASSLRDGPGSAMFNGR